MTHRNTVSEQSKATASRSLGLMVVASLAVVFVLRAGWLACATPPTDIRPSISLPSETALAKTEAALTKTANSHSPSPIPAPASQDRLSAEDFAMLSAVCPTAIDSLPAELLPLQEGGKAEEGRGIPSGTAPAVKISPPHRLTAAHSSARMPTARITGIRVASRPDWSSPRVAQVTDSPSQSTSPEEGASEEGWLVSPDVWFVPEDRTKQQLDQEEATPPAAATPSTTPPAIPELDPSGSPADSSTDSSTELSTELSTEFPPTEEEPTEEEPERVWPVLPPKPAALPEPRALPLGSSEEIATPTPLPPLPPELTLTAPEESQGPLLTEPDFLTEPQLLAEPENDRAEEHEDPAHEAPSEVTSKAGPLFAAPLIEPAKKKPSEPQATEQPTHQPSAPSPPAPVQVPENLPTPKSTLSQEEALPEASEEREATQEIVPVPEKRPTHPTVETPVPTPDPTPEPPVRAIEPESPTESLFSPAPLPSPAKLFAPPTVVTPPVAPSVHGAGAAAAARQAAGGKSADLSHAELFSQNCYPSAKDCAKCHEKIYDEWSLSSHAYAYVSPMFHRFEQKINDLSQGTVGTFCLRCHSPAGISMATALGQTRATPISETSAVARDGVGCISCHRVNERYGKVNGERRIVTGNLFDPVYGGLGGDGVAEAIANKTKYKLKTSASEKGPGQPIHNEGRFFDQLTRAEACTACHQVAVHPGLKLEVVWEQYRASPACEKGVSCQDCHMGRVPGVPAGYTYGPIAEVAGKTVRTDRKQSNHSFYGPGYSIAHPGVFPQHPKSDRWTIDEWMLFDWRAGWGTKEFEDRIADAEDAGQDIARWFPSIWREEDDRYDARDIIDDNLEKLKIKHRQREMVMENGSKVDGPFFRDAPIAGQDLKFEYVVTNLNEGHNLPTASLGAQPQLWANVVLIGPDGRRVWESGYTDSQGDLCDIHSEDVQKKRAPYDSQLFNLQTMFLITGATGTDREFYLPVNLSIDQVAHLRPGALPVSVLNHPPFIRMESRSIAPLGKKRAKYRVPAEVMCQPGHYRLSFRLRSRVEPMYFMRFVGATEEMQRAMSEGVLDIHPMSVEFEVKAPLQTAERPAANEGLMR